MPARAPPRRPPRRAPHRRRPARADTRRPTRDTSRVGIGRESAAFGGSSERRAAAGEAGAADDHQCGSVSSGHEASRRVAYGERGAGHPRAPPVSSRTRRPSRRAPHHASEPKASGGAPRPAPRPRTLRVPFFSTLAKDEPGSAVVRLHGADDGGGDDRRREGL